MSELITMDGEYVTRDGKPVRLLCVDRRDSNCPVVAIVTEDDRDRLVTYFADGRFSPVRESNDDLLPKPKRHKRTVYINVYQDNGDYYLHSSRKSADVNSATRCGAVRSDKRIACLELHLDFAEGEGLEP